MGTGGWEPSAASEQASWAHDGSKLHPNPSFPGMNFACSGEMSSTLLFDYYGDPDVPINELLVCFDTSDVFPKDPGYVYTCYSVLSHIPFGPDAELSGSRDVEACCLRESPEDAVAAFCRIDAAQDFCLGLNDNLNELRKKIPLIRNRSVDPVVPEAPEVAIRRRDGQRA